MLWHPLLKQGLSIALDWHIFNCCSHFAWFLSSALACQSVFVVSYNGIRLAAGIVITNIHVAVNDKAYRISSYHDMALLLELSIF